MKKAPQSQHLIHTVKDEWTLSSGEEARLAKGIAACVSTKDPRKVQRHVDAQREEKAAVIGEAQLLRVGLS